MTDEADYIIQPALQINPGETRRIAADFLRKCAIYWRPEEDVALTEYVRPTAGNGLAAQCSVAGTTGAREPHWPTLAGRTVVDGSVTWTMVAAGANGLNAISAPSVSCDIAGVTTANVAVAESRKIQVDVISAVIDETEGELVYTFTLNSVTRIARQKVTVKKA